MIKCDNCGRIYHDVSQVSKSCKKCGIGMCTGCGYYNDYICDDCTEAEDKGE